MCESERVRKGERQIEREAFIEEDGERGSGTERRMRGKLVRE